MRDNEECIDPEKIYENRYKQIKSTYPRYRVYWSHVFTTFQSLKCFAYLS